MERLTTGAGQWGSARSFGCMLFGLKSTVYVVKASYYQKPYIRVMMARALKKLYPWLDVGF